MSTNVLITVETNIYILIVFIIDIDFDDLHWYELFPLFYSFFDMEIQQKMFQSIFRVSFFGFVFAKKRIEFVVFLRTHINWL